ncbi:extracellular solute-binding protein [Paenibacillus koleovorans]|uniref:extracellular solute-binding protein n=1 Tax=Paenibacillus koleovorans TaxID=121608 RepID=UPI000FD944F6|nr:extracellular solute-binding protein [Paenibacillus koleovorans]
MKKMWMVVLSSIMVFTLLAGCSGAGSGKESSGTTPSGSPASSTAPKPVVEGPVTVTFLATTGPWPEESFQKFVAEPVKKKYPNITVKRLDPGQKGSSITELVASGDIPDIVSLYAGQFQQYKSVDIIGNMDALLKAHQFNTGRITTDVWETGKMAVGTSHIAAIPLYLSVSLLYYNKDLFDKFAIGYPKDGMTYDEIRALGNKLNREDGGVSYRGFHPDNAIFGKEIAGLQFYDPATNKATMNTQKWQDFFRFWESQWDFNFPTSGSVFDVFLNGQLAMRTGGSNNILRTINQSKFNWDVVTAPQMPSNPGYVTGYSGRVMGFVTKQSKNQDAAMLVLETILSDEVQLAMSKNGLVPVLNSKPIQDAFGSDFEALKGKNMKAIFMLKQAPPITPSIVEASETKILQTAFTKVVTKQADINTALREADEEMNKALTEALKK